MINTNRAQKGLESLKIILTLCEGKVLPDKLDLEAGRKGITEIQRVLDAVDNDH